MRVLSHKLQIFPPMQCMYRYFIFMVKDNKKQTKKLKNKKYNNSTKHTILVNNRIMTTTRDVNYIIFFNDKTFFT